MPIEFRTCEAGDLAAAINPIWHYFGRGPSEEDVERMGHILPTDRVHVAVEDGKVVGGGGRVQVRHDRPRRGTRSDCGRRWRSACCRRTVGAGFCAA